jgi:hypothetical protein
MNAGLSHSSGGPVEEAAVVTTVSTEVDVVGSIVLVELPASMLPLSEATTDGSDGPHERQQHTTLNALHRIIHATTSTTLLALPRILDRCENGDVV